jgi:rubrerythrin
MALDRPALDEALTREIAGVRAERPLRFRLGDAFFPTGTAPPAGARLRCCTCGLGASEGIAPAPCPLCGSRAWELLPTLVARY